jgi:hypothetical protein
MVGLFLTAFQVVAVEAERGDTRDTRGGDRVDTRDTRVAPRDPRGGDSVVVPRDTRVRASVDTRAPVEQKVETRGLSQSEMIQECKKTYGKKRKNKAAKQACIAAAKGQ